VKFRQPAEFDDHRGVRTLRQAQRSRLACAAAMALALRAPDRPSGGGALEKAAAAAKFLLCARRRALPVAATASSGPPPRWRRATPGRV
jgi:hypothetical protein